MNAPDGPDVLEMGVPEFLLNPEYQERHRSVQAMFIEKWLTPAEEEGPSVLGVSYNPTRPQSDKQRSMLGQVDAGSAVDRQWFHGFISKYQKAHAELSLSTDAHDCKFGGLLIRELLHKYAEHAMRQTRCVRDDQSVVVLGQRRVVFMSEGHRVEQEPGADKWAWTRGRRPTVSLLPPCAGLLMDIPEDIRWAASHYLALKPQDFTRVVNRYLEANARRVASPEIHDWDLQHRLMAAAKTRL